MIIGEGETKPHGIHRVDGKDYIYNILTNGDGTKRYVFAPGREDNALQKAWELTYGPAAIGIMR